MDSHSLMQCFELGWWTVLIWFGPSNWGVALSRFFVAPQVGLLDGRALVGPLELG